MRYQLIFATSVVLSLAAAVQAAPINYGDLTASTITYQQVREDSSTDSAPLFGTPTVSGDSLLFNPVSFGAFSSNGLPDLTNGTLATTIAAKPGQFILAINLSEAGDYTLGGTGTAATKVSVAAPWFIRVTEVNNAPLPNGPLTFNSASVPVNPVAFSPSGGTYDLVNDPTSGIWTGSALIDISVYLAAAGISGEATKLDFSWNNDLLALSEQGTVSFIKKKQNGVTLTTITPEPTSLSILALAGAVLGRRRR
jgi:hypothetical protein